MPYVFFPCILTFLVYLSIFMSVRIFHPKALDPSSNEDYLNVRLDEDVFFEDPLRDEVCGDGSCGEMSREEMDDILRAKRSYLGGDFEESENFMTQLMERDPRIGARSNAYQLMGVILQQRNDVEGSMKWFKKHLDVHPTDSQSYFKLSLLYSQKSVECEDEEEKNEFSNLSLEAIETGLSHVEDTRTKIIDGYVLISLFKQLLRNGQEEKVKFFLEEYGRLINCEYSDCLLQFGIIFEDVGLLTESLRFLELYYKSSFDLQVALRIGVLHFRLGNYEVSLKYFKKYQRSNRDDPRAYFWLAAVLVHLENPNRAVDMFNLAEQLDPENPYYVLRRADILESMNLLEESLELLGELDRFEGNAVTREEHDGYLGELNVNIRKAGILRKLNRYKDALSELYIAVDSDMDNEEFLIQRAVVFKLLGEEDEALDDLNVVVAELNPNNVKALNNRGVLFERMNNYDAAWEDYNEAVRIDPSYLPGVRNKKMLRRKVCHDEISEIDGVDCNDVFF